MPAVTVVQPVLEQQQQHIDHKCRTESMLHTLQAVATAEHVEHAGNQH